jgi:hypothetical protein
MMTWYHSDLFIGEPVAWRMRDNRPEAKFGIYDSDESQIPYHDEVWRIIQKYGTKGATSIRGLPLSKERICIADRCFKKISDIGVWAVGWVGASPANIGATVNYVAKTEGPEGAWLMAAMNSPDYDVRHLTAQIVQAGLAKVGPNVEAMARDTMTADRKIGLEITDKAVAAMAKGVPVAELILKCPKCREYLAKLEAAGVEANVAVADINARLLDAVSKPFAGFKDFAACVASNSDKDDPEAYCATVMRAAEGKIAGERYAGFEAPEPRGDYSEHQKTVLAHAYSSCRAKQESEGTTDKEKCSKIAHAAADSVGKDASQVVAHGTAIDKGVTPMAEEPKDKPKEPDTKAAPTEAAKAAEPKKEDYEAAIKTLIARVEALEGKAKGGEDFMKSHEDLKKSLDELVKKFTDVSERVLAIEGKIGVPAVSKRGEPTAPADTGGKPDIRKMSVNELLAYVAKG